MECTSESFLGRMWGQNSGICTSLVTIHHAKIVRRIAEASTVEMDMDMDMDMEMVHEILRPCQSADLTKDLHPHPQPDAIFYLLSATPTV